MSIAAGRYDDDVKDGLVVAYAPTGATAVKAVVLKFDAALQNIVAQASTAVGPGFSGDVAQVIAKSAKLNWFGATTEQVVIAAAASGGTEGSVWIYSFSPDLQFLQDVAKFPVAPADANLSDLAIGNFAKSGEPDLQLAVLFADADGPIFVSIFATDPSNHFALTPTDNPAFVSAGATNAVLAAGDTQGRSLLLGAPLKVAVTNSIQPDVILGMPPMHIDYIRDKDNLGPTGTPSILKVTAAPSSFFSQYQTQVTGRTQSSNTHTPPATPCPPRNPPRRNSPTAYRRWLPSTSI